MPAVWCRSPNRDPRVILAFALLFYTLVLALCAWVTLTGRDAWPFSAYPMFASYRAPAAMEFHRLRFVGERAAEDLTESDRGLADEFDRAFSALWRSTPPELRGLRCARLVRSYWCEASTLRPSLLATRRLEVVVRFALLPPGKPITVVQRSLYEVDAAELAKEP
jgi:hypothetical protein